MVSPPDGLLTSRYICAAFSSGDIDAHASSLSAWAATGRQANDSIAAAANSPNRRPCLEMKLDMLNHVAVNGPLARRGFLQSKPIQRGCPEPPEVGRFVVDARKGRFAEHLTGR